MSEEICNSQKKIGELIFEISYIKIWGCYETLRYPVYVDNFESMLHVMKYRKKKTLIYDATSKHNSTTHPNSSFTQDYIDTNIRN